jgi:phage gp46-like protein
MTDIALEQIGVGNFNLRLNAAGNDLLSDEGLETAVILSLFTDRRLPDGRAPNDGTNDPRGWWGDIGDDDGVQIGSHLWLLWREKVLPQTVANAITYCREALQWMIDDGIAVSVDVIGERAGLYQISIGIAILRPTGETLRYAYLWDGQLLKFQRSSA